MAEDNLITKNDLSEAIQAIEVKYQALGDKTHGRYVELLLDELKAKGFDVDNPDNIKRLDNFVLSQEFLDITTLDELVMSDDMGRLQGTFLDDISNLDDNLQIIDTPTNVVDDDLKKASPIFGGREGLPITPEQDRMLEIKWAENWSANGEGWGQQVHGTYTAEVVDGFYQFKADNPDIPNWWFPRDFMDGQQLTQRAFVGWGVTQKDIDDLKEGFEKGIFDKEKNKKLLKVVNDLDGSDKLIKSIDTPTNVVDDLKNHFGVPESEFDKPKKIVEGDFVKATTLEVKGGLHARPTGKLGKIANDSPIELFLKTPDGYTPFTVVNLWSQPGVRANPDINNIEVFIKKGDNANEVIDYFNKNAGVLFDADGYFAGTEAETSFKVLDTPGGSLGAAKLNDPLVFDSWVDNYAKTTTSFVDNLPLSTTVKNQFDNLVKGRIKNLATPGGVADAVDLWELGVLALMIAGIAFNEIDEVPTIITNTAINMFNSMTAPYGIAPLKKEEYDIDYEFINTVLDTGSKVMPTDIIIEKLKPYSLEEGEDVILPGTGVTATTGAKQQFEPYGEELAKRAEKTVNMKRDEVKQKILESKGVQEEKMFEQAKPKKSKATGGAGAKIL